MHRSIALLMIFVAVRAATTFAQEGINRPPIEYATAPVADRVAQLQKQLESGAAKLEWDDQYGWLPSLLKLLEVPQSSQALVFSKTSLQIDKISPERPRALYFNDDVYLGTVQFGDLIELSAVDPEQGAIFYSIEQSESESPKLVRDDSRCLSCHHTSRTRGVPGYLVRSVFTKASGHPRFDLGSTTTDPTTDFKKRYGGWYVTGTHGRMRHRGNTVVEDEGRVSSDEDGAANVTNLDGRVDTSRYLLPHSDLVAIMVLEHQAQMHNAITRASYEARRSEHYDKTWNKILDHPPEHQSDVSKRRIAAAGDQLLEALLFSDEYALQAPVAGTSEFATQFQAIGPCDDHGRSLRDFDLERRLFKYPCSYLIYSDSFASLPTSIREYVDARLGRILSGEDESAEFAHLSQADRSAIREILRDTLSGIDLGQH